MANASTEQRELALVEKVDLRILNVANNEAKLQQLLGTYLPPLLLKGGSEHASVRAKVPLLANMPGGESRGSHCLGHINMSEAEDLHTATGVCIVPRINIRILLMSPGLFFRWLRFWSSTKPLIRQL